MEEINLINGGDSYIFEKVGSLEGFEYSTTRSVVEDVSGPQSSIYITSKFGRRSLSWQSIISSNVFVNRRALLQAARQQGNIKTIQFTTCDNLDLQAEIEIVKITMPYKNGRSLVLIEAVAPDWRFYSQTLHQNNSASMEQTITNAGNEITDPVFRIYGPFTIANLINLANSQEFTITQNVIDGDYIEIDVKARTVTLNGVTSEFNSFSGDFITFEPGDNILDFTPTGGGTHTSLRTSFRDAYNGI